jgi:hypothetical protein
MEISEAGLLIARQVASAYSGNPNIKAIIISGSVSRGVADPYSDLEMGIIWLQSPTTSERKRAIARIGGDLWAFDREPGNEHIGLNEIMIGGTHYAGTAMLSIHHLTVADIETCLTEVFDQLDTSIEKQNLISAIENAIAFYGEELVHSWQNKISHYPDDLVIKIIQENLWFGPWFCPEAYISRDDRLVLHQHFLWIEQGMLKVLAALNHIYFPSSEYKWVDGLIEKMKIVPQHFSSRLKEILQSEPQQAWQHLRQLIDETITLVETYQPEVNQRSLFKDHPEINISWAKQRWKTEPPYSLMENIRNDKSAP